MSTHAFASLFVAGMVAAMRLWDDIAEVNFRFACRVYNMSWLFIPSPIYFYLETKAWEDSLKEDPENPATAFPILFEELLFSRFPDYYDAIVQEVL